MKSSLGHLMAGFSLLAVLFQTASAVEWETIAQQGAGETGRAPEWKLSKKIITVEAKSGNWVPGNGLESRMEGKKEARYAINFSGEFPAVRVEYCATALKEPFSDLSVFVGQTASKKNILFGFGTENNQGSAIKAGSDEFTLNHEGRAVLDKPHRVVAELNGTIATLWVDGKPVAQHVLNEPLPADSVSLYNYTGNVRFHDVKIMVKEQADPPATLKVDLPKPVAVLSPNLPGRFDNLWSPRLLKTIEKPSVVDRKRIPLYISSETPAEDPQPLIFGVPFPQDQIWNSEEMRVVAENGVEIPSAITPTATWTEKGSLKWVLVDLQVPLPAAGKIPPFFLEYGNQVKRAPVKKPLLITETPESLFVDTGLLQVSFSKKCGTLFDQIRMNGVDLFSSKSQAKGLYFVDQNGALYTSVQNDPSYRIEVETRNEMRAVIKASGWYSNAKQERSGMYVARVYLYRNQPTVKLFTTWIVTADTDAVQWQDIGVRIPFEAGASGNITFGKDRGDLSSMLSRPAGNGSILMAQTAIRSCHVRQGKNKLFTGRETGGWVDVARPIGFFRKAGLTLAVTEMAGQFPNALEVLPDQVVFHAFSNEAGPNLGFRRQDVRAAMGAEAWERFEKGRAIDKPLDKRPSNGRGLAKTHELTLTFRTGLKNEPNPEAVKLALCPPLVMAAPEWNCASLAFGPFHPYDTRKFPEVEAEISGKLDEWIFVTRHLNPHYGFYDHGRGIPHYMTKRQAADGEPEWAPSGYRRNYDLGYWNTIAPWVMYLRGGDRRWLNAALNSIRYEMDVRLIHPTDPGATGLVGMKYCHQGSWSFDGWRLHFQDAWFKNLALCYYVTGYQRALDVFGEIMTSLYNATFVDKNFVPVMPDDRTGRTAMTASVAVYYKTTWDPKYWELYKTMAPGVIATQKPDGTYGERWQWMEYFFSESLFDLPQPLPVVAEAYRRFTQVNLRCHERQHWDYCPFSYWWEYCRTRNPLCGCFGKMILDIRRKDMTFIDFYGYESALVMAAAMKLAALPGADQAALPQEVVIPRPYLEPICFQHQAGQPTRADIDYTLEAKLFDAQGQAAPDAFFRKNEELLIYELNIPANVPSRIFQLKVPRQEKIPAYLNNKSPLLLPWYPDSLPLKVTFTAPSPLLPNPTPELKNEWRLAEPAPPFPEGCFGLGARLCKSRAIRFKLGKEIGPENVREFFDAREGTIDFRIRFEHIPGKERPVGRIFDIPGKAGNPSFLCLLTRETGWYSELHGDQGKYILPIRSLNPVIEPGFWHQVALMWKLNDNGKVMARGYLDGYPCHLGYAGGAHDNPAYWPATDIFPVTTVGEALIFDGANLKDKVAFTIDEFRVSSVARYPYGDIGARAFVPDLKPCLLDDQTLILHHFEGKGDGESKGGRKVVCEFFGF